jgi:hypothetical protein
MFANLKATIGFACLAGLIAGTASAQDNTSCDKFKWSIARERALFAAGPKPAADGATVAVGEAYAVALAPSASVAYSLPPERAPKTGTFGAALKLAALDKPGLYQVTLSDEAWLDVVQGGAEVKSTGFSGQKDCPGVRKTVRFDLQAGPATIQLSNAAGPTLNVALEPAQ